MTKHPEIYYHYDDLTRTIFWTEDEEVERPDLIFVGSSINPNKKMAVTAFVQKFKIPTGYKILEMN